jgi:hypothetical protein
LDSAVRDYLDGIKSPKRRRDAEAMVELMCRATGEQPGMWRSIVAFGEYQYRYESGREGSAPAAGFAARAAATTVYLSDGVEAHAELRERLGPHKAGVGCLYIKDLNEVDLEVLEAIIARSYATLTAGTHTNRAREGPDA